MTPTFSWPAGKRAAVSLTFDDARPSQIDAAIPILDSFDIRAAFYVCTQPIAADPAPWRSAASRGHEIGNHTVNHPCSANFAWCKNHLEDYTLDAMRQELVDAQHAIHQAIGVTPVTFAYPCGNKFVGRGDRCASYVPLVARRFLAGRGFRDGSPNNPRLCDLAQLTGIDADRYPLETLTAWIDRALREGSWICFVNHDCSPKLDQAIHPDTLKHLCDHLRTRGDIWVDTVANIAAHIAASRQPEQPHA